ncbi:MAG: YafY family transcriptional regulator [Clostridiales bacterium]|nr:YafY family transcriptional regulator [Clostridiales bacterium]
MRIHRLIRILMKIEQDGKVKARDMAQALEVSCRTIYRDIDVLCEAGYPIITATGQNGGISFIEGYKLKLDQTDDILRTLIANLYTMPEQEKLINALESGMSLKYTGMDRLSEGRQKIIIDQKSWWDEASTEIDLQPIIKALFLQQKLRIYYTGSDGEKSERIIAPYGLVLKYTTWYLVAYCYTRNDIRTFNCSRICHIALLEESYSIPNDFALKDYWSLSVKAFKESRNEKEYYPVEIKVHKSFAEIFRSYDIIGLKQAGDSIVAMVDLHRKEYAINEIRVFLGYGQILYPEEMKQAAKEILVRSLKMYDTNPVPRYMDT